MSSIAISFASVLGEERGDIAANLAHRQEFEQQAAMEAAWQQHRNQSIRKHSGILDKEDDELDEEEQRLMQLLSPRRAVAFEDLYKENAGTIMGAVVDALERVWKAVDGDTALLRKVRDEYRVKCFDGDYADLIETSREYLFKYAGIVTEPYEG
jgi:hypothetical protein